MHKPAFVEQMKCHIFSGKRHSPSFNEISENAYHFWFEIWSRTFEEVVGQKRLFSDDFLRQDEILCLSFDKHPIGLIFFDYIRVHDRAQWDHSYFKFFPPSFFKNVSRFQSGQVMVISNLTVHPEWRKASSLSPTSHLLLGLAVKRLASSFCEALLCFTRNDRKTHRLVYDFGGTPLERGIVAYGIPSDIIAVEKDSIKECPLHGVSDAVRNLWDRRIEDQMLFQQSEIFGGGMARDAFAAY